MRHTARELWMQMRLMHSCQDAPTEIDVAFMSQTDCTQAKSRPAFTESAFSQWSEIMHIFWHVMYGIVASQSGKKYIHAKVNMKDHLRPSSVLYFRSRYNRKAQWKLIVSFTHWHTIPARWLEKSCWKNKIVFFISEKIFFLHLFGITNELCYF